MSETTRSGLCEPSRGRTACRLTLVFAGAALLGACTSSAGKASTSTSTSTSSGVSSTLPTHNTSSDIDVTKHVRAVLTGSLPSGRQFGQVVSVGTELVATAGVCPVVVTSESSCRGEILVSKNHGMNWSVQLSDRMAIDDLAFAGAQHGWATAGASVQQDCAVARSPCGGEVLKTSTSKGDTVWHGVKRLRGTPAAFLALSGSTAVVSDDTCKLGNWICRASVLATDDGGRTWSTLPTPAGLVVGLALWPRRDHRPRTGQLAGRRAAVWRH